MEEYMEKKEKNLEARNQVLEGVLRTPLALICGGPVGVIVNAVYTAASAKHEIDREEAHKQYLESLKAKPTTEEEWSKERNRKSDIENWLKLKFNDAKELSSKEYEKREVCYDRHCKYSLRIDAPQNVDLNIPSISDSNIEGVSYCLDDFYKLFAKDMGNPSIQMLRLGKTEFCYKVPTKPYYVVSRTWETYIDKTKAVYLSAQHMNELNERK